MKSIWRYLKNLFKVLVLVAVVSFGMATLKYVTINYLPEGSGSIMSAVAFVVGVLFLAAIWDKD